MSRLSRIRVIDVKSLLFSREQVGDG